MATTPFDPLWKYIFDEGSDEEQYEKKRCTRKYRGDNNGYDDDDDGESKRVSFKLPLSRKNRNIDDSEDDLSLIELVSMDIAPKKKKQPEKRSLFKRESSKDARDDDDETWSFLSSPFPEEEKAPPTVRRGILRKSKHPAETREEYSGNILSLMGVSQSLSGHNAGDRSLETSRSNSCSRRFSLGRKQEDKHISDDASTASSRRLSLGRKRDSKNTSDPNDESDVAPRPHGAERILCRSGSREKKVYPIEDEDTEQEPEETTGNQRKPVLRGISFCRSEKSSFGSSRDKSAPIFAPAEESNEDNGHLLSFLPSSLQSRSQSSSNAHSATARLSKKQAKSIMPYGESKGCAFGSFLPATTASEAPDPERTSKAKAATKAKEEQSGSERKSISKSQSKRKTEKASGDTFSSFLPSRLISHKGNAPSAKKKRQPKTVAKARDVRKARIAKVKAAQNQAKTNQDSPSLGVSKTLVAAGAVAVGIATAGVVATSELFDISAQPKNTTAAKEIEGTSKVSGHESEFWDIFSPSDEEDDGSVTSHYSSSSIGTSMNEDASVTTHETEATVHLISLRSQFRDVIQEYDDESAAARDVNITINPARAANARQLLSENDEYSLVDQIEADFPDFPDKRGIGRIACCSVKHISDHQDFFDLQEARGDVSGPRHYMRPNVPVYNGVKMVADEDARNVVVANGQVKHWHESHKVFLPDAISSRKGPQSLYTYEYDSPTYLAARYESFGTEARGVITVLNEAPFSVYTRSKGDVTVKIEASTVSYSDCRIRNGKWWGRTPLSLPLIPGVDFVGKIDGIDKRTSSRSGLRNGDMVMSLVRHGGNARYTQIGADKLVKVPDDLEAVDVVCLAESYLSAFQAVHSGQRLLTRYKKTSLSGKSILVIGALTNFGRAVVELANAAGATLIYAPCKLKHRDRVRAMGTSPLGLSKDEWMPLVNKKLDLVIDTTIELNGKEVNYFNALSEKGHYLFIGRTQNDVDRIRTKWTGSAKIVCSSNRARMASQIHSCDVFENWESNIEICKHDLGHLMKLLQRGEISPKVLDRVPLYKVAKAQQVLDQKRLQGFLVCEPWIKSMSRAVYL